MIYLVMLMIISYTSNITLDQVLTKLEHCTDGLYGFRVNTQLIFIYSMSTIESVEKGVKHVQS